MERVYTGQTCDHVAGYSIIILQPVSPKFFDTNNISTLGNLSELGRHFLTTEWAIHFGDISDEDSFDI
jgi:hypothetical protein